MFLILWFGQPLLPWLLTTGSLFSIMVGIHYVLHRQDINKRLHETERFAHATIDALSAHICVLDEHGTILAVNRAWIEFAQANQPCPTSFSANTDFRVYSEGANYLVVCEKAEGADSEYAQMFRAGLRDVIDAKIEHFSLEYPCHAPHEQRWFIAQITRFPSTGPLRIVVSHENITARKLMEEVLRVNLEKYRVLFETFPLGVMMSDQQGNIVETNQIGNQILGVSNQEAKKRTVNGAEWHVIRPDGTLMPPHEYASVRALEEQRLISNVEMGIIKADGQITWISVTAAPIPLEGYGVAIAYSDITERKQDESQLRKNQQLFAAVQQIIPIGSYEFDLTTQQMSWSDEVREIFGFKHSEWPAPEHALQARIHPTDLECWLAQVRNMIAGKPPTDDLEYRIVRPDGSQRTILLKPRLLYDDNGVPTRVVSALLDVTNIRHTEEERDQLVAILEATPDLVGIADPQGHIIYLNPAGRACFGLSNSEAWNERSIIDFHPSWAANILLQQGIPHAISEGFWQGETAIQGPNSCEIPASQVIISHFDSHGRLTRLSSILRDLSEQKRHERALRESEERLRQVTETLPQIVWLGTWDEEIEQMPSKQQVLYVSSMFEHITGYTLDNLIDDPDLWVNIIHPEDRGKSFDLYRQMAKGSFEYEYRIIRADGTIRYIHDRVMPIRDETGEIYRIAGLAQDITERKQTEVRLQQAAIVFDNTLEGVIITNADTTIVAINRAFTEITGYSEEEAIGQTPRLLYSGKQDALFYQEMWSTINSSGRWQGEIWNRRKNGEIYPQWLTIRSILDSNGSVVNHIAVFSDISKLKQSEEQIAHLAHYDTLTNLPNRFMLLSRLEQALHRANRYKWQVAVLFLDLDRFKNVNDSMGHPVGDELLIAIGQRLTTRVRQTDTLSRLGGDEFVMLLESIYNNQHAAEVAAQLIDLLQEPFALSNGYEIYVGCSIGISIGPIDGQNPTQLIRNADTAMYQAKARGGNTFQFYTESMTHAINERLDLERKLRRAIERPEFVLHYQPQIDVSTGQIIGVEALIRWQQPDRGLVSPAQFIPIAEETGLIIAIGEWTLRTACAQGQLWRSKGFPQLSVAVNLSVRQFRQHDLADMIGAILVETGLPADWLELEITESLLMEQPEHAIAVLNTLKELGVRLAIDDFGTGYSSLSYLQRLSLDRLKIDQSFITDLPEKAGDAVIVSTIIAMAQNLKLDIVAEGVETQAQLDWLRWHGCTYYQGHLFGRPVPADQITTQLSNVEVITSDGR